MLNRRMLSIALLVLGLGAADARADQTIVFMRHGEKPSGGYGQMTCQGLGRALALPTVLAGKYGKPTYIYAPNPAVKITDSAGSFYYVRPIATIEPTAIRLGMPVNTRYGYNDIASLQAALITSTKANTTAFVAWEHLMAQKLVQNIMNSYGGSVTVPGMGIGRLRQPLRRARQLRRHRHQRVVPPRRRGTERPVDHLPELGVSG
jgi:hypothetical protein